MITHFHRPGRSAWPQAFVLFALLCGLAFAGAFGARQARAALSITLTPVPASPSLVGPVGIDYHQPTGRLLVSVYYNTGVPHNFEVLAPSGAHSQYSTVSGLTDEVYISSVRTSSCMGGFTAGQSFFGTGVAGDIARLDPTGTVLLNPWVNLPGETGLLRGGLFQDQYCAFGGDLIVTTNAGNVWRVTSAGAPTKIASGAGVGEGPTTVPNNPTKYGPLAGTILTGNDANAVTVITAGGVVTTMSFGGHSAEGVQVIPPNQDFFAVDYAGNQVVTAPASAFSTIVGDLLVRNEDGVLQHVFWDGTAIQFETIATTNQFEGATFAPNTLEIKQQVYAEAKAALALPANHNNPYLQQAVSDLKDSVTPSYWLDGNHVKKQYGERVFYDEIDAVQQFVSMLHGHSSAVPAATLQSWITALVAADRALATNAIASATGDSPGVIAKANRYVATGDGEATQHDYEAAMNDYLNAWYAAVFNSY